MAHEIATMSQKYAQEIAKGQMAINQVEAAHKSLFVSGWRPALGWCASWDVLGTSLQFHLPTLSMALLEIDIAIPLIPLETMMPVSWECWGWGT